VYEVPYKMPAEDSRFSTILMLALELYVPSRMAPIDNFHFPINSSRSIGVGAYRFTSECDE